MKVLSHAIILNRLHLRTPPCGGGPKYDREWREQNPRHDTRWPVRNSHTGLKTTRLEC